MGAPPVLQCGVSVSVAAIMVDHRIRFSNVFTHEAHQFLPHVGPVRAGRDENGDPSPVDAGELQGPEKRWRITRFGTGRVMSEITTQALFLPLASSAKGSASMGSFRAAVTEPPDHPATGMARASRISAPSGEPRGFLRDRTGKISSSCASLSADDPHPAAGVYR